MNVMRMFTELKEFNYQQPNMYYDKATGEIKVKEKAAEEKKKVIKNINDLEKEKQALFNEIGLDEQGKGQDNDNVDELAEKLKKMNEIFQSKYDIDPSQFYVFTRDQMRVDVGLMIQRAPIFMQMRKRDVEFLKFKNDIMNEYYCNQKQYIDDFEEISRLNENILGDNPYNSKQNVDNFPTHRIPSSEPGQYSEYAAASKHFSNVDPTIQDRKTLHYAGEDRTYLIFKNKYTQEWEFPTGKMYFGQSFVRGKQNLFTTFSGGWRIKYSGQAPILSTIREFTEIENQDKLNNGLKGVRSYYFQAHHWRGLTDMVFDNNEFDDFAWIPKRQLNEYFSRDYYDVFIHACMTR